MYFERSLQLRGFWRPGRHWKRHGALVPAQIHLRLGFIFYLWSPYSVPWTGWLKRPHWQRQHCGAAGQTRSCPPPFPLASVGENAQKEARGRKERRGYPPPGSVPWGQALDWTASSHENRWQQSRDTHTQQGVCTNVHAHQRNLHTRYPLDRIKSAHKRSRTQQDPCADTLRHSETRKDAHLREQGSRRGSQLQKARPRALGDAQPTDGQ